MWENFRGRFISGHNQRQKIYRQLVVPLKLRMHYQAMVWHHAGDAKPKLPPADGYEWKKDGTHCVPIKTGERPAPEAVVDVAVVPECV